MQHTLSTAQQHQFEHVKSAIASNQPFTAYAKQNDLDIKALYNWKADFVRKGLIPGKKKKTFTKVSAKVLKPEQISSLQSITAVLPNGITLNFSTLSQETLQLLKAL
jgi:hypothetical protein